MSTNMSLLGYDVARRYRTQNVPLQAYYLDERRSPLACARQARADPQIYTLRGSVVDSSRRPLDMERDEPTIDGGPVRRRIAVACARCRKRKIRCSGDPGNGIGCKSCRSAGVDALSCQFHRVGSDNVHKVMSSYHQAHTSTETGSSNGSIPISPAMTNNAIHSRSLTSQTYPHNDNRSMYPTAWSVPYAEDTSPVETFGLDQAYLPNPNLTANTSTLATTSMYSPHDRWNTHNSKLFNRGTNTCYDQSASYSANCPPYMQNSSVRATATNEVASPLSLVSLRMALPERQCPRQYPLTDSLAPQRQLPMPQSSQTQTSRNAVDQLQDERLRSRPSINTSHGVASTAVMKKRLSWSTDGDEAMPTPKSVGITTQLLATTDASLPYAGPVMSIGDVMETTGNEEHPLSFSSSSLVDSMTASVPASTYSNFRETRIQGSPSTQMARHDSQTNLYSFNPDSVSKRKSYNSESSNDCKLVGGHQYQPLIQTQPQCLSSVEILQRESFENRNVPLRVSMRPLNSSF
ncbi:hypothetical protein GQ44DRAFT_47266 [Phaeosphaeriaceae sp. PMI808]|nr:hypothetical protein GQ44DRAFT_47266 [Phaeosphaeriaceae sp. PMI808]